MTRLEKMHHMKGHVMLGKLFAKLNQNEMKQVKLFLLENEELSNDDYMHKVNRWFLNDPAKPKHHVDMWSIVSQCK